MKKILLLGIAILTMLATGCTKDGSESLKNTTWVEIEDGYKTILEFSKAECIITIKDANSSDVYSTLAYNYVYIHPKVTFTPVSEKDAILEGSVIGSSMRLVNTSKNKEIGVFIKQ